MPEYLQYGEALLRFLDVRHIEADMQREGRKYNIPDKWGSPKGLHKRTFG